MNEMEILIYLAVFDDETETAYKSQFFSLYNLHLEESEKVKIQHKICFKIHA